MPKFTFLRPLKVMEIIGISFLLGLAIGILPYSLPVVFQWAAVIGLAYYIQKGCEEPYA